MTDKVPLPPPCWSMDLQAHTCTFAQMHAYADSVSAALRADNTALQNDVVGPLRERVRALGESLLRYAPQAKLKEVPRWWHCDTHGPGSHAAWGCPECVRDMRAETKALQAQHDDDKSDLLKMQRERDALRDMLDNALLIVRDFATRNPKHTVQIEQDPWGAHRWLDEYAARRSAT